MLFVAEYDMSWDNLDAVVARRLEWSEIMPEGFSFVGEYVWQSGNPPFRGVAIIDCAEVDDVNAFVLHYGPTLTMRIHPATDVMSGIAQLQGLTNGDAGAAPTKKKKKKAATRKRTKAKRARRR